MKRNEMLGRLKAHSHPWDMVIIGGGRRAWALPSMARPVGLDVLLLEREDFGKATSSRSTKLVHGGVRYLEQGNISLVMEALKERGCCGRMRRTWCMIWRSWCRTIRGGRRRSTASA
jgi:glycerol-3-phosphate dehydrogenase